jgi:hypothetical protein
MDNLPIYLSDFSEMNESIFLNLSGNMPYPMNLLVLLLFTKNSLPVGKYGKFSVSEKRFVKKFSWKR